jgi:hypothetical protein
MQALEQQIRAANEWGGAQNQPHSWTFTADGKRVYFLLNGSLKVCSTHAGLSAVENALERDAVRRTLPMTREEELLRERMRSSAQGVSSFQYHASTDQLLVVAEGTLFTPNASSGVCAEIKGAGARLHTCLSSDGAILGFVRNRLGGTNPSLMIGVNSLQEEFPFSLQKRSSCKCENWKRGHCQ